MEAINLGTYKNKKIIANLQSILSYNGQLKTQNDIAKSLGSILIAVAIFYWIALIILTVLAGNFSLEAFTTFKITHLFAAAMLTVALYGLYLRNHKKEYVVGKTSANLYSDINKVNSNDIDITKYFMVEQQELMDTLYFRNNNAFFLKLLEYVIVRPEVQYIINKRFGIDPKKFIPQALSRLNNVDLSFNNNYKIYFYNLFLIASEIQTNKIDNIAIFLFYTKSLLKNILREYNISDSDIKALEIWIKNNNEKARYIKKWEKLSKVKPIGAINRAYTSKRTPVLDSYSQDLTAKLVVGKNFITSLSREKEVNSIIDLLQKNLGAAVLLVGEAGVGKARIIEYFATKLIIEEVPRTLQDYRLVSINLNEVYTQTLSLENFKLTLQNIFNEIADAGNIIIYLENFDQILSIRQDGRLEVINMIINLISKTKIKFLATATPASYTQNIKPLKTLASLFHTIDILEPDENISLQILIDEMPVFEKKYGINMNIDTLKHIVKYANKFSLEQYMPEKGLILLEEAIIKSRKKNLNFVDIATIDEIISEKLGVTVGKITDAEKDMFLNLENELKKRVVGQNEAISAVAAAVRRARIDLSSGKRPIASFLFFGPTGVGKTETAKALAQVYYGSDNLITRLDMSEFQEDNNLNKIIGFVDEQGNFKGGYLTESIRKKPFSLVLLDELEKANPKVLDLFLQILDEGNITDGLGRKVDFTNTIIIATSNVGSKDIMKFMQENKKYSEIYENVTPILKQSFRIEFLNRFDRIIMFEPLKNLADFEKIVEIQLNIVKKQLLDSRGVILEWTPNLVSEIATNSISKQLGAREIKRVLQQYIEDEVALKIIQGELGPNKKITFEDLKTINII